MSENRKTYYNLYIIIFDRMRLYLYNSPSVTAGIISGRLTVILKLILLFIIGLNTAVLAHKERFSATQSNPCQTGSAHDVLYAGHHIASNSHSSATAVAYG
uniref:Uncharacterized protein n=1 Tax=Schizaphis graminum TaxID=13262 RepID=A0A2S2NRM0_SCHGA